MSELPGFKAAPVWEFTKYDGRLVAGVREHKGGEFFDLRLWAGENGDKPTAKGVTMPLEAVPDLVRALTAFVAKMSPDGPKKAA